MSDPQQEQRQIPRACNCRAENIGLSDGSSVYGWECSKCGHKWPRTCTERGMWKFEQVAKGA